MCLSQVCGSNLRSRVKPNVASILDGRSSTGTLHRCKFTGIPDHLEEYLTSKQTTSSTELYYGKKRTKGYFQHLFVEAECTNGLPKAERECLSTFRIGQQCGPDEDWSVIAPDEFDGPGVMWRNDKECDKDIHNTEVTVAADFFCPVADECIHLTRCSFDGEPTAAKDATNTNDDMKALKTGYFEHVFKPEECSKGLPPAPSAEHPGVRCVTSLRFKESCGGDHDWEAFSPAEASDGAAKVRWYTSHSCDRARVGVDYYCSLGPSGLENKRRLHRCTFKGKSEVDKKPKAWCENRDSWLSTGKGGKPKVGTHPWYATERHAGTPAPGFCMMHEFVESECTNGLPPKGEQCLAATHRLKECGAEQDFHVISPTDKDKEMQAGLRWYNGIDTGPCGEADITVDYYCDKECVVDAKTCKVNGIFDEGTCSCKCTNPDNTFWRGLECSTCGAEVTDCDKNAGLKLDEKLCKCVPLDVAPTAVGQAEAKKAEEEQAATANKLKAMQAAQQAIAAGADSNGATKQLAVAKANAAQAAAKADDEFENIQKTVARANELAGTVETVEKTDEKRT